jgi:hypothetical protein
MVPEWQVANVYICLLVAVAAGKLLSYLRKQDCRSPRAQVQREDPAGPSIESLFQLIYTSDSTVIQAILVIYARPCARVMATVLSMK